MKYIATALIGLLIFAFQSISEDKYELVWSDEFDHNGSPHSEKWKFSLGDGCPELCGWGNAEKQVYTSEKKNIRVENGNLVIQAHKESDSTYTSAKITTEESGNWKYGRVEVRAKLPRGRGTWPAIWMLPKDWEYGGWPKSGEIDIMEHVGFDQNTVHGTVHTESFNHMLGTQKGKSIEVDDASEKFHVYAVEWDEKGISFLVDDVQYNYFENTSQGYKEWPFDKPFYLIINLAVGGNWGGREGIDNSVFPQQLMIDYVRIYSL